MDAYVKAGRISGIHSGKGELNVATYDVFPTGEDFKGPLFVFIDRLAVPLFISSMHRRSNGAATIRFDDIDNTARASYLVGLDLYIPDKTRKGGKGAPEGSFADMDGWHATLHVQGNPAKVPFEGEVTGFFNNDANPLFEVTVGGKEVYIPAVSEFVAKADPKQRHIVFTLPEGLTELYL